VGESREIFSLWAVSTTISVRESQSENISLDSPTDIVVDAAQSEKISLDSPTDIVVDTAQSEKSTKNYNTYNEQSLTKCPV
jgi:hypothetical protein